jgi:hypothetical protein
LLKISKIVRLGDPGDLMGFPRPVDLDRQLLHLPAQPFFAGPHFTRHRLENPGQLAQRV